MIPACANYSGWMAWCKGFGILLLCLLSQPAPGLSLSLESGPGRFLGFDWQRLELGYALATGDPRTWQLSIHGLVLAAGMPAADLVVACRDFEWSEAGSACSDGGLHIALADLGESLDTALRWSATADGRYQFFLEHEALSLELAWPDSRPGDAQLGIELLRLDLALLPAEWLGLLGLDVLGGAVSGELVVDEQVLRGELRLEQGLFDGLDGQVAGDGVALTLEFAAERTGPHSTLALSLRQTAGELLLGALYLDQPESALSLHAELIVYGSTAVELTRFELDDPGAVYLSGSSMLRGSETGWTMADLQLDQLALEFPAFWTRWMEGPAAAAGLAGLETEGRVSGSLHWDGQRLQSLDLALVDLALDDPRERLALYGLAGQAHGTDGVAEIALSWEAARLFGLPLGAAGLRLHSDEVGLRLLERLRIPLLDGAIVIDGLAWFELDELPSRLVLDAAIEPVSLGLLTRQLGWPEFGGRLSGSFPGVEYSDERLAFTGGMAVEAFSGQIRVEDLTVERPFGTLPAVAAQVEFDRLDLLELTGAFNFGRMEGQVSGWARDLRLLDWRPVAMDARVFTHEDVPRRRISQRAVDNLSSLGGAGGAIISGTILRVFDDFPYRRAGLACRLSNNICHIDGVARHDSGGFLMVEGRGLPRLDIVGHRRLVDWPQFVGQLEAMLE